MLFHFIQRWTGSVWCTTKLVLIFTCYIWKNFSSIDWNSNISLCYFSLKNEFITMFLKDSLKVANLMLACDIFGVYKKG